MRSAGAVFTLGAAALFLGGCPILGTDGFATGDLYAYYRVEQLGSRAIVRAQFFAWDAAGPGLVLGGGDKLDVNGVALVPQFGDPQLYYTVVLAADVYRFHLRRPGEDPIISVVEAPAPARILEPEPGAVVFQSTGFRVAWENTPPVTDSSVQLDLTSARCGRTILGTGTTTEPAVVFLPDSLTRALVNDAGELTGDRVPILCDSTYIGRIHVDTHNAGVLDPRLPGQIDAYVRSSTPVTLVP